MDIEGSEVVGKVLNKHSEALFQICPLSPFLTASTMVQASLSPPYSSNQPLTELRASVLSHLSSALQWLAEFPVKTPSLTMLSIDCMAGLCVFLP